MSTLANDDVFREARRELNGLTAGPERRVLHWLAARVPARIGPDHLTALGFLAMILAGAAYAFARKDPAWLHLVNVCLFLNWFGDSLDGTVARYRNRLRPRYGFYVDHLVDAFGALFLMGGLATSGLISPGVAFAILIAYYLMTIHMGLATHVFGTFKISYGPVGGTELRILLALANLLVLAVPRIAVGGDSVRVFDLLGAGGTVSLTAVLLKSAIESTVALYRAERILD